MNVNVPDADGTLVNANDPGIYETPVSVKGSSVDGNRTDQTQHHNDLLHL